MKMANENKTNPMSKSSKISNYLDEESCSKEEGTNCCCDGGRPQKQPQKMNSLGLHFAWYVNIEWENLEGFYQ